MLLGARSSMLLPQKGLTAKSYVRDGLVAMWDGIENVGWGKHDPSATTWKDLIGSNDGSLVNSAAWDTVSLVLGGGYVRLPDNLGFSIGCVECCFTSTNTAGFWLFELAGSNRILLGLYGTNRKFLTNNKSIGSGRIEEANIRDRDTTMCASGSYLYRDGQDITSNPNDNFGNASHSTIGIRGNLSSYPFAGSVYAVRAYSRILTADEIAHNYAIDKVRFGLN